MSSAAELRTKFKVNRRIVVTLAPDLTIECRSPDLAKMVLSGLMTWPALQRVRELTGEPTGADDAVLDNRPVPTLLDRAQAVGAMLDEWVCSAAVSPRVVLTEAEQGDDALWIEDLPFEARQAIFNATFRVTPTAGGEFRGDEPRGAPPGPDSAAVRDETLIAVGDPG